MVTDPSTYRIGACGGNFTTPSGLFTSPSYPDSYPNSIDCVYTIMGSNGTSIKLVILQFDINSVIFDSAPEHYLDVIDGALHESPLIGRFNGKKIPPLIQSTHKNLRLR